MFLMRSISVITLGVKDLHRSTSFYEKLGFSKSGKSATNIVWFRTEGTVLALYPWELLAEDASTPSVGSGFRGITLALNMLSRNDVNNLVQIAREAGAQILKKPQPVFWGGYSGYFTDPDGHLWEVAHNPFTLVDEHGNLNIE
ncbi:MAG: VOC family protein [Candidatus Bathyarchaeota archaeon]|nr:VOC family protein [Candidatus Bathyarchaeota archaeon]